VLAPLFNATLRLFHSFANAWQQRKIFECQDNPLPQLICLDARVCDHCGKLAATTFEADVFALFNTSVDPRTEAVNFLPIHVIAIYTSHHYVQLNGDLGLRGCVCKSCGMSLRHIHVWTSGEFKDSKGCCGGGRPPLSHNFLSISRLFRYKIMQLVSCVHLR